MSYLIPTAITEHYQEAIPKEDLLKPCKGDFEFRSIVGEHAERNPSQAVSYLPAATFTSFAQEDEPIAQVLEHLLPICYTHPGT